VPELSEDKLLEDLQAKRSSRRERRIFNKRTTFFSVFALILFAILAIMVLRTRRTAPPPRVPAEQVEHWKELAARLMAKGLPAQAMRYYERYLEGADLKPEERANVSYIIGDLAVKAGQYEDALVWLNGADLWGAPNDIRSEVDRLQRLCFERLGRSFDADYQLASSASLDAQDASPRGAVVAKLGSEKITMGDIDDAIMSLPKSVREIYSKPEKKAEFIQQYISNRVLHRKAKSLGYDRDPKVRKQIEAISTGVVVQAFVKKEIQDKVEVTDTELDLFYKVHQGQFGEPAQARLAHILVGEEKEAADLIVKLKADADFAELAKEHSKDGDSRGNGGEISNWLSEGGALPPIPQAGGLSEAVFPLKAGDLCETPIQSSRGFHVVKVLQKKDARVKPLSEIRQRVEALYRMQKQEEILAKMLKEDQEKLKLEVFPEAMAADAPVVKVSPKDASVKIQQPK